MKTSIIIPTLNEAACIAGTVRELRRQRPHEIIVVDGDSTDDTRKLAGEADLLLRATPGRASQMNHGATRASGDALLFLHADCVPEDGGMEWVERALSRRGVAAGCFRMRVGADGIPFRLIDAAATARVRLTGIVYGDQGLFLRRELFEALGGFPALRLMEDVFFSLILRRRGRVVVVPKRIFVSPRRWRRQGVVRQTLRNWTLTALAVAGVHPDRLASYYPAVR